ncbi:MAG: preprotein translocase subunit SecD [Sulfurovum sp. PC08-66]|nr:MAG: preprotein translocase subunit SecD [Sulfurovum sp. PC08-66]KIM12490.1 MAG: preprotein translocase subunit SecD [Sulfuricurvum sp. PC08-66]
MKIGYRAALFGVALLFGLFYSLPTLTQSESGSKITLGLDLQGGLHLLLGVEGDKAIEANLASLASSIAFTTNRQDILLERLQVVDGRIEVLLLDSDDADKFSAWLYEQKGIDVQIDAAQVTITLTQAEKERIALQAVDQAVETIRNRLDQFGLSEPTVAKQGNDKILVELPGIKTQEEEERARALIAKTAHLQLMAVDEPRMMMASSMSPAQAKQHGDTILSSVDESERYVVKTIPILDGSKLTDAQVAFDVNNQSVINFTLNAQGAQIFGDFTEKNVGKRLAVVLDGVVYSAPVIRERIGGGHGQISGDFTVTQANDLAIALRSGALLAPVYVMEKRLIGPSLGQDSIDAAMLALVAGFALVILFMVWYYRIAGVIANIALLVNILLIIAVMALLGATLTLPGMAGIVLTVGMAVDANVIISERIRELLSQGSSMKKAIELGYANAMRAIVDANITTLIAAVVLYVYGTGPIKGFAITISIGILASMLTAIVGTHGIYEMFMTKLSKTTNTKAWFGQSKGA